MRRIAFGLCHTSLIFSFLHREVARHTIFIQTDHRCISGSLRAAIVRERSCVRV